MKNTSLLVLVLEDEAKLVEYRGTVDTGSTTRWFSGRIHYELGFGVWLR